VIRRCVGYTLVLFLAMPAPAHAYADPGSGLLLWQLLGSFLIGLSFYFRRIIAFVKRVFAPHDKH
jgi:hypothetical protein